MKTKTKRIIAVFLVFALLCTGISAVFAVDSSEPQDLRPTVVTPSTDTGTNTGQTVATTVDPERYDNETVKDIVSKVNAGEALSPSDIIEETLVNQPEGKQDAEDFELTDGRSVNTVLYNSLTPFMDLGLQTSDGISLTGTPGTVTIEVPMLANSDKRGEDLLIMQIHPVTGEISLIPLSAFDAETGQLTANFSNYGPFAVISKVPLVDRECDPDRYGDQEVAEYVRNSSQENYLKFSDWLQTQGITDGTFTFTVTVDDGNTSSSTGSNAVYAAETEKKITLNVADYEAVTLLSDVAVRLGVQNFSYNLSTKIKANLYQNLDRTNWTKILKYAGIKYNVKEIQKNPQLLKDIEPFVLKDSFVYHIDAQTREVSIIYEPTIFFDTYDEAIGDQIQLQDNQDTGTQTGSVLNDLFGHQVSAEMKPVDQDRVTWFYCDDIDEDNTANLNMVISGDGYIGLGPFILFMPKTSDAESLWWLWILLAVVVIAVVVTVIVIRSKKNKKAPV